MKLWKQVAQEKENGANTFSELSEKLRQNIQSSGYSSEFSDRLCQPDGNTHLLAFDLRKVGL